MLERDCRFDDARGWVDDLQRGERERDAVADRECRDDGEQALEAAAEQQQADDEEDVVGADGDVVDARSGKGCEDGEEALTGTGEEIHRRAAAVQDFLPDERVALVDVDERLMVRIVGKHVRGNRQPSNRAG